MTDPKPVFEKYTDLECRFGISTYTNPHTPGFAAVLKARYSDFIVKEVDLEGNLAALDSIPTTEEEVTENDSTFDTKTIVNEGQEQELEIPVRKKAKTDALIDEDNRDKDIRDNEICGDITDSAEAELAKLVGNDHAKAVTDMLKFWNGKSIEISSENEQASKNYTLPIITEKEKRKALHLLIRSNLFEPFAVADTMEQKVRVWHRKFHKELPNFGNFGEDHGRKSGNKSNAKRKKDRDWPAERGNYLRFVLYKENIDTGTAVKDISRILRLNPKQSPIGYAGMKDKRGITGQFCTVFRKYPSDMVPINKYSNGKGNSGGGSCSTGGKAVIRVGNFSYSNYDSRLGRLTGNRFDIALRNVNIDESYANAASALDSIAVAFKEAGFINYFGMQRFGKYHDTHEVGIAVLKNDFESAVNIIMRPKASESNDKIMSARKKWQNRFEGFDKSDEDRVRVVESRCAKSIARDFGRFNNTEQSLMESLSRKPRDYRSAFLRVNKNMKLMFLHAVQSYFWNKAASFRMENGPRDKVMVGDLVLVEDKTESEGGSGTSGLKGKAIKIVQEDDRDNYSITDVVLPLLGSKIKYPTNCVGLFLETLLKEQGLSKDIFSSSSRGELSLGGDYRGLIVKPSDVDWSTMQYKDPVEPLIQTDLMKLNGVTLNCNDGNLIGMVIGFTLPPSSYATVALRELMKRPTDSEYQSGLKLEGQCESITDN